MGEITILLSDDERLRLCKLAEHRHISVKKLIEELAILDKLDAAFEAKGK